MLLPVSFTQFYVLTIALAIFVACVAVMINSLKCAHIYFIFACSLVKRHTQFLKISLLFTRRTHASTGHERFARKSPHMHTDFSIINESSHARKLP